MSASAAEATALKLSLPGRGRRIVARAENSRVHPLDPYRAATLLIRQHGADFAEDHARNRQLELLGEHDEVGAAAWAHVLAAIRAILRAVRTSGEAEH